MSVPAEIQLRRVIPGLVLRTGIEHLGSQMVVDKVDAGFVLAKRREGASWIRIAEAHTLVKSASE